MGERREAGRSLGWGCVVCAGLVALGSACGGPTRFDPGPPGVPTGLLATPGDHQVTLSWQPATVADAYRVYYSTSASVSAATGTGVPLVTSTSTVVTGLADDTTYYFVVTSVNSHGQSAESAAVPATPTVPGPFSAQDLAGTWDLVALVAGPVPGWMRGRLAVDAEGAVTVVSFLDSEGGAAPPAALFPSLHLNQSGGVRNAPNSIDASFTGDLETVNGRKLLVGTTLASSGVTLLAVMLKRDPAITFGAGDLKGFGSLAGGGRRFTFSQCGVGTGDPGWEYANGQVGQDLTVQYTAFDLLPTGTNPAIPGKKATTLGIDLEGAVTEVTTPGSTGTAPAYVFDRLQMSSDKSVMVGVTTAPGGSGADRRFALRLYELVNIVPSDAHAFSLADLAGTYRFRQLSVGAGAGTASGQLAVDATGAATYASYSGPDGGAPPPTMRLSLVTTPSSSNTDDAQAGQVGSPDDASLHGKLSYFSDLLVFTRTAGTGVYSLTVAVK